MKLLRYCLQYIYILYKVLRLHRLRANVTNYFMKNPNKLLTTTDSVIFSFLNNFYSAFLTSFGQPSC
jgi:hypothetical protein